MPIDPVRIRTFIATHTTIASPPLCPEIRLYTTADLAALQEVQHSQAGVHGCPYWSVAWAGGQALARHILDHPHIVRGKRILDFGSGSGLCAFAAALAGAASVKASDIDPVALIAIEMNAELNDLAIETTSEDLTGARLHEDVLLAADLWYEKFLAQRLNTWLRQLNGGGCPVLLGDTGRAYFPRTGIEALASHTVPTTLAIEQESDTVATIWQLRP